MTGSRHQADRAPGAPGTPRSPADAERVARFDQMMQLPLVLASVLPILFWLAGRKSSISAAVVVASWVIFLVDLVVHTRLLRRYVATWRGRFDLFVVVATGPWILIPALAGSGFLVLVRLARVARVLLVTKHARRLVEQLGRGLVVGVAVVFVCSDIAYRAEKATNSEFENYADSLWWAIVTICTVGYGDITPKTSAGRWAGVMLMVTGIGIIGALAGSLASFLRLAPTPASTPSPTPAATAGSVGASAGMTAAEITSLRARLSALDADLERLALRAPIGGTGPGPENHE